MTKMVFYLFNDGNDILSGSYITFPDKRLLQVFTSMLFELCYVNVRKRQAYPLRVEQFSNGTSDTPGRPRDEGCFSGQVTGHGYSPFCTFFISLSITISTSHGKRRFTIYDIFPSKPGMIMNFLFFIPLTRARATSSEVMILAPADIFFVSSGFVVFSTW